MSIIDLLLMQALGGGATCLFRQSSLPWADFSWTSRKVRVGVVYEVETIRETILIYLHTHTHYFWVLADLFFIAAIGDPQRDLDVLILA